MQAVQNSVLSGKKNYQPTVYSAKLSFKNKGDLEANSYRNLLRQKGKFIERGSIREVITRNWRKVIA